MAEVDSAPITITAFDWVPDFAQGQVRDLRVRWALEEVGRDYAVRYLSQGEQKQADHRARQPFGQVPTYEEDDLVLFESGAIVWWIAANDPGIMPESATARAKALEWLFAALNTLEPPIMDRSIATIFEAGKDWSKPRLPAVETRVRERLQETANRLGDGEWFEGAFSVGDLMMVCVLRILDGSGLLEEFPALAAYRDRGVARPAFGRALAAQMTGFTGDPPPEFRKWQEKMKAKEGEQA